MPEDNGTFPFQIKSIILDLCRLLVEGTDFLSVLSQPGIDGKRTHFNNALGVADVSEMMGGGGLVEVKSTDSYFFLYTFMFHVLTIFVRRQVVSMKL